MRESVLENGELLELVLLHLELRTLICARRVCRRWQTAMNSPALQEAQFFRPQRVKATGSPTLNTLLMQYFPAWFAPRNSWKERYELEYTSWTRDPTAREKFLRPEASWKRMLPVQPPFEELRLVTRTHIGELRERKGRLKVSGETLQHGGDAVSLLKAPKRRKKRNVARWNGKDINMGLIYHLAQTYLRERVVSYFCMLFPDEVQQVLDAQIKGTLPSSSSVEQDTDTGQALLGREALEALREEQTGCNTLTVVFEQLRNWFEPSDHTGDWLEEQNAIFARLTLRSWQGPVIWDDEAIEWEADEDG